MNVALWNVQGMPSLTRILLWFTPSVAVGLSINQIGDPWTQLRRREYLIIGVSIISLAIAVFVAYGRLVSKPF